ncbi:MAG TPA: MFS transporter [Peptococcaceae bacterium]|nr:MFS transporter [Peptococcaceae bacterium]
MAALDAQKPESTQPPLWTKNFILIMLVNLFVFLSFQMLLPTMPLYVEKLGGTEDIVGLVTGVFTITAVGLRPFAGRALDTQGRKRVYFLGVSIIILSILGYSLVPTIIMLFIFRMLHGIGWGLGSTATGTIATDIIPKTRLGEGMGFYGLTTVVSMAVAPALGLQVVSLWGFSYLFYISGALAVLGVIVALFIKYQLVNFKTGQGVLSEQENPTRPALLEKSAYKPTLIIFFVTLTYGSVVTFIALYAAEFNIANIGIFFTVYALTLFLARPTFGKIADRKGFGYSLIPGLIFVALTMVILFLAQNLFYFIVAAICYGIGFGAVQPSLQAMAVYKVPPYRRGAANGTFMSGFDLGIGIGSMLWGFVAKYTDYHTMYLLAVIPVFIAFFLYLYLGKEAQLKKVNL